ncbi:hypothetical protein D049_5166B, partial [Vibrio parahaemolyticus VPTS-2010]
SRSPFLGW